MATFKFFKMNSISSPPKNDHCARMLPIPLYRKNLENSLNACKQSIIRSNKYFSKISAVGENTKATLFSLARCKTIKRVYKFQFDAYCCEKSCIFDLCKIFPKMQRIKELNLVFRRLDRMNESKMVTPFVKKQVALKRLRLELPKTKNIDDEGIVDFAKMLGRCVLLESYEEAVNCLENVSAQTYLKLQKVNLKQAYLREIRAINIKMGNIESVNACVLDTSQLKYRTNQRLKTLALHWGVKSGWFSKSMEMDNEAVMTLKNAIIPKNIENLFLKFSGIPSINEVFGLIDDALSHFHHLVYCSFEFSNCRVSDLEVVSLCQTLNKARHIKRFTFKIIQYPNVSKDAIYYLAKTLERLDHLLRFDIYLRRLSLNNMELDELLECLPSVRNIEYVCFNKQSLHIFRNPAA